MICFGAQVCACTVHCHGNSSCSGDLGLSSRLRGILSLMRNMRWKRRHPNMSAASEYHVKVQGKSLVPQTEKVHFHGMGCLNLRRCMPQEGMLKLRGGQRSQKALLDELGAEYTNMKTIPGIGRAFHVTAGGAEQCLWWRLIPPWWRNYTIQPAEGVSIIVQ